MVSIIKNQILKHLEKFAKNLSVENINLSTFKGEGELNSLELNEIVLTDLLELPTWMKMTSATVNKVKFKIPFTKIKSVPIEFNLDNVQIEVETCESIRSMSMDSGLSAYSQPSAYNAIRKIVDGITVNINSVTLKFISPAFVASVHILRVKVQSKSPTWKAVPLKETLLKNKAKTQVLIFKELTWDSVRIEARSTMDKSLPPLRLLTNQARCRITIKKRLSDSYVLGSRLALSLDDLLWVLTDSQLTAALHFLDSLSGLVQQANELSRRIKAKRKLEELPEYHAQLAQQQHSNIVQQHHSNLRILRLAQQQHSNSTATSQQPEDTKSAFHKHDVMETSYHFLCKKFDIHLSDDPGAGRSIHPDLTGGGAWQITLVSLRFDFYPYHLASTNRQHWWRYTDSTPHYQWLSEAQESFKSKLAHVMDRLQNSPRRAAVNNSATANATAPNTPTSEAPGKLFSSPVKEPFIRQLSKLMTTCAVIQIGDFTLFKVTTNKEQTAREFIRGDVRRENVPGGDVLLHAEFTYYYYPGDIKFPLPSPKFYVQLNPIQIIFDLITLLWLNAFTLNLHKNLMSTQAVTQATSSSEDTNKLMYFDVKIEAIMMKLILDASTDDLPCRPHNRDRPRTLHGIVSRTTLTNTRSSDRGCSRADLAKCIHACQLGSLFYSSSFPAQAHDFHLVTDNSSFPAQAHDFHLVTDKFLKHAEGEDNIRPDATQISDEDLPDNMSDILLSQELLWTESKDIWCIKLEPVWAEFHTSSDPSPHTAVPFLDNFPLTIWAHTRPSPGDSTPRTGQTRLADIHAVAYVSNLISVQLNHYQVLFLLRLAEDISELVTFLSMDAQNISGSTSGSDTSLVLGALIPQLELTCVMPLPGGGKESSGIDVDSSVVPDSSSLATAAGGSVQWNPVIATHIPDKPECFSPPPPIHTPQSYKVLPPESKVLPDTRQGSPKNANGPLGGLLDTPPTPHTTPMTFGNLKRNFSEFVSVFKSPNEDLSDSLSIRSDFSDASDVMDALGDSGDNDSLFGAAGVVNGIKLKTDMAVEAYPEDEPPVTPATTTCSERDSIASSCKRKDLISVVTFKLGRVEFLQQSEGFASSIKVQVTSIANEECSSIPWDEFQFKFAQRSKGWVEIDMDGLEDGIEPRVKLRFDHVVQPQDPDTWKRRNPGLWFQDYLQAKLSNIDLRIGLDAVGGLAELLEDEIQQLPLPLEICLDSINVHLSPPDSHISPVPPIVACLDRLKLRRGADGKIFIEPNLPSAQGGFIFSHSICQVSSSSNEQRSSVQDMKLENEQLRRRLIAMEKLNEENHQLRKLQEESLKLRSHLTSSQEEVFKLEEENKRLQKQIKELECEVRLTEHR
ncbi:hypothetical protein M8J75_011746 [Diaphorina citri]|nr:hypothetical protein M8J75_011746 [Diaphorina citri]